MMSFVYGGQSKIDDKLSEKRLNEKYLTNFGREFFFNFFLDATKNTSSERGSK